MNGLLQKLLDHYHLAMHQALRHAPVETASALGSLLVRANVRFNRPEIIAGARRNLARHRPDMNLRDIDRAIWRFADNVGRHMGECSLIERIVDQGRVELIGHGPGQSMVGKAPLLSIHLHTGNWEVFGPALVRYGIPVATFYEAPTSAVQRRIIEGVRLRAGFNLLTPDARGLREALARLRGNGVVSIACDEARAGRLMAPLFGRRPHDKSISGRCAQGALLKARNKRPQYDGACSPSSNSPLTAHHSPSRACFWQVPATKQVGTAAAVVVHLSGRRFPGRAPAPSCRLPTWRACSV